MCFDVTFSRPYVSLISDHALLQAHAIIFALRSMFSYVYLRVYIYVCATCAGMLVECDLSLAFHKWCRNSTFAKKPCKWWPHLQGLTQGEPLDSTNRWLSGNELFIDYWIRYLCVVILVFSGCFTYGGCILPTFVTFWLVYRWNAVEVLIPLQGEIKSSYKADGQYDCVFARCWRKISCRMLNFAESIFAYTFEDLESKIPLRSAYKTKGSRY